LRHICLTGLLILLPAFMFGCATPDKKPSKDAESHYMYGVSYLKEGNATRALNEFLQAVEGAPDDPKIQAALGQAYHLKGAYSLAEQHYLESLKLAGKDPQVHNNLGALYLDMQQWDKAIEQFRIAANDLLFANPAISLTGMGVAYFNQGNYLDAVESCKKALFANPGYVQAHFYLGEAYYALNRTDMAVKSYLDALKISPGYVAARYRLAMAYMRLEQTDKAREAFREVLRSAPGSEQGRLADDYLKILQ